MDNKFFETINLSENNLNMPSEEEFLRFKKKIATLINLDLTNYKNKQMERRINSLMHKNGIEKLDKYAEILIKDSHQLEDFLNMLTINVSEFFRNTSKFEELSTIYFPEFFKKKKTIKIWSAGCSIGAEIYSICMILDKMGKLNNAELVASDFDQKIVEKAKSGLYNQLEIGTVPNDYKKYFTQINENNYQIDKKFISKIKFQKQDLLNSNFEKGFDLILCRNVVIYFTDEAKNKLYKCFYESLNADGILFIGSTERILGHVELGYKLRTSFFYQK
ncbi:MAG: protein-glutamate O-methyltransferase CheR [Candidatus Gastranaerophilaceae bacterium]